MKNRFVGLEFDQSVGSTNNVTGAFQNVDGVKWWKDGNFSTGIWIVDSLLLLLLLLDILSARTLLGFRHWCKVQGLERNGFENLREKMMVEVQALLSTCVIVYD